MKNDKKKIRLGIFIFLLMPLAAFPANAPPSTPPPVAQPDLVQINCGQQREITLKVGGRIVEPLNFYIRKSPRYGTLGEIRRTGKTTAIVVYTPKSEYQSGEDSFTFAAKSFDSPVSAPARIRLQIAAPTAQLEYPRELDFGSVYIGESSLQEVVIRNTGNGIATGKVEVKLPWKIIDSPTYRIPSGNTSKLNVSFSPDEEREFTHRLQIEENPQNFILLRGRGMMPISWTQQELILSPEQREQGKIDLIFTNHTSDVRPVTINWPSFVKAPREITIPPHNDVTVQGIIPSDDPMTFKGEVQIQSGNFQGRINLRVFPPPPKLYISPEKNLNLGEAREGRSLKGYFTIKNIGGIEAPLRATSSPEISIVPDPSSIVLAPHQEQAFTLELLTAKKYTGKIQIESPSIPTITLSVTASEAIVHERKSSLPVENFLQIPSSSPETNTVYSKKIPPVKSIQLVSSKPHEIVVRWKFTSQETSAYKIERRKTSINGDRVVLEWLPWPEARIHIQNQEAEAHFERMPSNGFWMIRIVALDSGGNPSTPSMPFRIATQPAKNRSVPWWFFSILAMALLGILVHLRRVQQQRLKATHEARILRLGNS